MLYVTAGAIYNAWSLTVNGGSITNCHANGGNGGTGDEGGDGGQPL